MSDRDDRTKTVPVKLKDGTFIKVEIATIKQAGVTREQVASKPYRFEQITNTLKAVVKEIKETLEEVKPDKASVKFGVEMAVESGNLTALIVKGAGKGNLEITLEWGP